MLSVLQVCNVNVKLSTFSASSAGSQVWNNAAELIQAYSIGRNEANAALNLLNHIPVEVGDRLAQLVKRHS